MTLRPSLHKLTAILAITAIVGITSLAPSSSSAATTDASIALAASATSVSAGSTFTVTSTLTNPSAQRISGVRSWLSFDSSRLEFVSVALGSSFDTWAPGENALSDASTLMIGLGKVGGTTGSPLTVATATFRAKSGVSGDATVSFYNPGSVAIPRTAAYVVEGNTTTTNILATLGSSVSVNIPAAATPTTPTPTSSGGGGGGGSYRDTSLSSAASTSSHSTAVGGGPVETETGSTSATGSSVTPTTPTQTVTGSGFTVTRQELGSRLSRFRISDGAASRFTLSATAGTLDETTGEADKSGMAYVLYYAPASGVASVTIAPVGKPELARKFSFVGSVPVTSDAPVTPSAPTQAPAAPVTSPSQTPVTTKPAPAPQTPASPVKPATSAPTSGSTQTTGGGVAPASSATPRMPEIGRATAIPSSTPMNVRQTGDRVDASWTTIPPRQRPAAGLLQDASATTETVLRSAETVLGTSAEFRIPAGTVAYCDGSRLFSRDSFTAPAKAGAPGPAPDGRRYGTTWEFGSAKCPITFDGEVEIALPVDTTATNLEPRIYFWDEGSSSWIYIDNAGVIEGGTIRATVDHFTIFTVMYLARDPALAGLPTELVRTGPAETAVLILLIVLAASLAAGRREREFALIRR